MLRSNAPLWLHLVKLPMLQQHQPTTTTTCSSALNWPRSQTPFYYITEKWVCTQHISFELPCAEHRSKRRNEQTRILCTNCELQHRIIILSHDVCIFVAASLISLPPQPLPTKKKHFPALSHRNIVYSHNGMFIHLACWRSASLLCTIAHPVR